MKSLNEVLNAMNPSGRPLHRAEVTVLTEKYHASKVTAQGVVVHKVGIEDRIAGREWTEALGFVWEGVQKNAYEGHRKAFFTAYRNRQRKMTSEERAERAFEMRAAFGKGVKVVDIISGEVTEL